MGEKEKELFAPDMVAQWFTADVKLGSLAIHLETPTCFAAGDTPSQAPCSLLGCLPASLSPLNFTTTALACSCILLIDACK